MAPITIGGERLVSVKEFGEWTGKSEGSVHWMIHTKKAPPSALIGGRRMFKESDCARWLEHQFEAEEQKVSA
ncbi:helix-turn-helix domain-containing protein [Nesterenkonia sp. AY15]|uniref:helix-turn-helix domain-containing protein n=1 Tax=Nesterenkonia sp. AY15 TaxID=2901139 RepID=UPI001F4C6489|nr:helix-turn-helix domain-containing protein [Nesterenkonia sp. AY15]MCH8571501.1 helix-turn-helix domain-containing protein [Nesterenkonia sp. AY15]